MAREMIDCPNHEGAYDCTPFCRICEGNQGYYPLPERINVMKVVSYDVQQIVNDIVETIGREENTITLDEVTEYIEYLVAEDFNCGYGHEIKPRDLIWQDQDGEEV